jgi:hypothetical protein
VFCIRSNYARYKRQTWKQGAVSKRVSRSVREPEKESVKAVSKRVSKTVRIGLKRSQSGSKTQVDSGHQRREMD